ncbi:hypothetical protein HWV62_7104 [Athelia sp. TMB]|nr:hypothetical protein HWV62_7104 [Athelia sp. TMB]
MIAKAATIAATNTVSPDMDPSIDAVRGYCCSVEDFLERTKTTIENIEALSVTPPPAENIPGLGFKDSLPLTVSSIHDRVNALDDCLEDMEIDYSFRPPHLPIPARIDSFIDAKMNEQGIRNRSALMSDLERLQDAVRIQGDRLCRQADIAAHVITAQQMQKREHDRMATELSEARKGLAALRAASDAQTMQITALAEQLRTMRDGADKPAVPQIDVALVLGEPTMQARVAIMNYAKAMRQALEDKDREAAAQVWRSMEPARQLTVNVCDSVFL